MKMNHITPLLAVWVSALPVAATRHAWRVGFQKRQGAPEIQRAPASTPVTLVEARAASAALAAAITRTPGRGFAGAPRSISISTPGRARLVDVGLREPDRRRSVGVAIELLVQLLGLGDGGLGLLAGVQPRYA